jgi:hypothetical protein
MKDPWEKNSKLCKRPQLGACGNNKIGNGLQRNCKIPLQELDQKKKSSCKVMFQYTKAKKN